MFSEITNLDAATWTNNGYVFIALLGVRTRESRFCALATVSRASTVLQSRFSSAKAAADSLPAHGAPPAPTMATRPREIPGEFFMGERVWGGVEKGGN